MAPDWSADWLHREAEALQKLRTQAIASDASALNASQKGAIDGALKEEMRRNTYDPATGQVTVSEVRAQAIRQTADHYAALFGDAPSLAKLREQYAMSEGTVPARRTGKR